MQLYCIQKSPGHWNYNSNFNMPAPRQTTHLAEYASIAASGLALSCMLTFGGKTEPGLDLPFNAVDDKPQGKIAMAGQATSLASGAIPHERRSLLARISDPARARPNKAPQSLTLLESCFTDIPTTHSIPLDWTQSKGNYPSVRLALAALAALT
ncbi:uncharacterized protein BO97DRAFT_31199 [Aspergillus homomorphus CBS 101889]|uniref:Uncharacterized protein n=1 Tax=Aspergillus homomorphus (strain CBS 101889) TaxID=1450537 RepID=A0A395I0V4_ASPHC|nr:hypothetical protein BO97DRAFT_31199 [Aspergillus homomorphus CBS 101889]RAL13557.1 hypothetical protein BO97DRAFT_31199 [Aspergillus homomorphus CBS 101889]